MSIRRRLLVGSAAVALATLPWLQARAQGPGSKVLAGLISELSGVATIRPAPGAATAKAERFDGIFEGGTLELGPQSRVLLVLAGGQRFELGSYARATIGPKRLTSTSGPITEHPPLSPLPKMVALDDSRPKGPPASIRLRTATITGLLPSHSVTVAERTVLRFNPLVGASRYAVSIENESGQRIFASETTTPEVVVTDGALTPGTSYYWTVQALDMAGQTPRGLAEFRTLSAEDARFREELRQSAMRGGNEGVMALLAEVDRRLGLYQEALDGFRAQLARTPNDVAVQQTLRRLEQMLGVPSAR